MVETVLCYIENEMNEYLMLYRNKEENDMNEGKCLGIGGHLEKGETPDECLCREVYEETGVKIKNYNRRGLLTFKDGNYQELIYLYTAKMDKFNLVDCNEGSLFWIDKEKIFTLPLWEGDIVFLKKLLNNEEGFNLILYYENNKFIRSENMTFQKFIKDAERRAIEADKEESAVILLMEHVAGLETNELYMKMHEEVDSELAIKFNEIFDKYLNENKPMQYLIGTCCFYGYDFIVNEDVLIPRYETEELVENILYRYDEHFKGKKVDVCDLATGSGCIAISLALEEKNMNVVASDISEAALKVAEENNKKFNANVKFMQGDMLEPFKGMKFDIFVSNPPYIPEDEEVMSLVKDNEPNIALFGGNDGMKFYRIILSGVKPLLKDKAMICFEHGFDKKEEMIKLAKEYFPNSKVEVLKDLEGKDRMTFIYVGDFKWEE